MDDLTAIDGIGPATAKRLAAAGITTFEQLAQDTAAGRDGVKIEWIVEAAIFHAKQIEARPDASGAPSTGEPSASTDPAGVAPAGTYSTDTPPSETAGGAGNLAGPALFVEEAPVDTATAELLALDAQLNSAVDSFSALYPRVSAAIDAFQDEHADEAPSSVRITSKRDGFRRAGVAHAERPTDHRLEEFGIDALEIVLAEPMLKVELI